MTDGPRLSVCIPCYNEAAIIDETAAKLTAILPQLTPSFEIVFCNDGSGDATAERLAALAVADPASLPPAT